MLHSSLTRKLQIDYPILQAPMAGGPAGPDLAAAVSEAGGLGQLGVGYLTPQQIREAIRAVRQRTDRPFGVNLFVPGSYAEDETIVRQMWDGLAAVRARFGLDSRLAEPSYAEPFEEQVQAVLEEKVPVLSFTFGVLSPSVVDTFKHLGTFLIGTATTVDEAKHLEAAGVDAIVAQGSEAGGHRGSFLNHEAEPLIGTLALVPQIADSVTVPVIAAGGIMDGRGLAAILALGADAAQMGTAFLACPESGAHPVYKQRVMSAVGDETQVTRVYSGKAARGIVTEFMREVQADVDAGRSIPSYPIQHVLTRDIRQAAAKARNAEYMSLWAGQGVGQATDRPAAEIVRQIAEQAVEVMKQRL